MMFDKIKGFIFMWLTVGLGIGFLIQTIHLQQSRLETAELRVVYANEKADAAGKLATAQAKIRATEADLQTFTSLVRKATNDQVRIVTAHRDVLLDRVRLAEARAIAAMSYATPAAKDGEAPPGGAQPELLGSIGVADVEEAARADTIRLHLTACYDQYDKAVQALK